MEAKRILPWKRDIDGLGRPCLRAETAFGMCEVYEDHSWCVYDIESDDADNQDAALDACEAAYVRTCTEFLHLYTPATHVVVSREAGERVAKIIEYDVCGRENCKCGELAAELRAAMEGA